MTCAGALGSRFAAVALTLWATSTLAAPPHPSEASPSGRRRAVVIGIDRYQRAHWPADASLPPPVGRDLDTFSDLKGAVHDADNVVELLVGRFGFARRDILVLKDLEATRANILGALERWLVAPARPDDTLVFYFSGHGSRIENPAEADATDETLVPADSVIGALDVRDDELARVWSHLVHARAARLTVILDSCHSGGMSRGGRSKRLGVAKQPLTPIEAGLAPAERSDRALFLSASQDFQEARETSGTPASGAFTRALIEAVLDDPTQEASSVLQRVQARLVADGLPQRADLRGGRGRGRDLVGDVVTQRPLVFPVSAVHGPAVAESSGRVELLGGAALGLTVGSRLSVWDGEAPAPDWEVEVTRVELGHAFARQRTPPGRALAAGDRLVVTTWVSGPDPLRVALGPPLPREALSEAAREVQALAEAPGVTVVAPGAPSDFSLRHEGGRWRLEPASGAPPHLLPEATLSARGVRAALAVLGVAAGRATRLEVLLPPSDALAVAVQGEVERSGGVAVAPREEARYELVGHLEATGDLAWSWLRRREPGATDTVEPARTFSVADTAEAASELDQLLDRLARVHGWLTIGSRSAFAGAHFPYELTFEEVGGRPGPTTELRAGLSYNAVLTRTPGAPGPTMPHHVYLLNIDAFGNGTLVFPTDGNSSASRCPRPGDEARCVLGADRGEATLTMCDPAVDGDGCALGPEAFILIASEEPLNDLAALGWDGVSGLRQRSKAAACTDGLACLLATTGTRGPRRSKGVKGGWAVTRVFARSAPAR